MKPLVERICKLLTVKSIVTIILTVIIAYLAVVDKIDIKEMYLIIISFYFGTQAVKEWMKHKNMLHKNNAKNEERK